MIFLENIKSNDLSLVFSKIVFKGLCCDKVWAISIFLSCTPIRGIYRLKSLLNGKIQAYFYPLKIYLFETFSQKKGSRKLQVTFLGSKSVKNGQLYHFLDSISNSLPTNEDIWGAFHLGKKPGNFGGRRSGISDW